MKTVIGCVQAFNFEKDGKLLFVALNVHAKIVFECVQAFNMVEVIESLGIKHTGSKRKNWMSNRYSYNVTITRTRSSREDETSRRERSRRKDNARKITRPS